MVMPKKNTTCDYDAREREAPALQLMRRFPVHESPSIRESQKVEGRSPPAFRYADFFLGPMWPLKYRTVRTGKKHMTAPAKN